jgi:S-adenosylmethionine/arginine decarboxylase-like enzyme
MYSMSPKSGKLMSDEEVMDRFKQGKEWGLLTSIDLRKCDPAKIASKEVITQFSIDLCNHIDMKRFGEPIVVRFGADPRVQGYSLAQLIETSLISGHFAEDTDRAFIDVFSCKEYPPKKVAEYCAKYFGAKEVEYSIAFRT